MTDASVPVIGTPENTTRPSAVGGDPLASECSTGDPTPRPIDLAGRHVHFVGIGGCGMSALARIVRRAGAICTGTDMAAGEAVQALRDEGFDVALEQAAPSIPEQSDLLVISAAIKADHPQVVDARHRGVKVLKYAQLLGQLMIGRTGVAIAGTHGKSTTTSMLGHILICAGLDPSLIVGATCRQIGGGARVGQSDLLLAEACEYDRSFHNFHPQYAVILNVEEDHLDIYPNLDAIVASFTEFAARVPDDGWLLVNHEMPHRLTITSTLNCRIETIGFAPQSDWTVEVEVQSPKAEVQSLAAWGFASSGADSLVRLHHHGGLACQWCAPMPGEHMAFNAAAAAVTAYRLGATWTQIAAALETFQGIDRRMQWLGTRTINGATEADQVAVVDDYGHHPTEIDITLRALRRRYRPKRLICIFQPHQHSRTRFLMEQFAASFSEADIVIVPQIYFVRDSEQERHAVRASDLVDRLRQRGKQAMHLYPFAAIVEQLLLITRPGDLVVTMGAGDVWEVARGFLDAAPGQ